MKMGASTGPNGGLAVRLNLQQGFTLIEIVLVVGIIGITLGMGAPSFYRAIKREPMRRALVGVADACDMARTQAILHGRTVSVVFDPIEGRYSVEGGAGLKGPRPDSAASGQIDDSIGIEMLDVNLIEYREAEAAKVRFFANGTCDEFTLILHSDRNEWRKLTVEPTTGIVSVGDVR